MAQATPVPLSPGPAAKRLRTRATYASVAVAAVLIAIKFVAWLNTGSVALLSSLVDSLLDMAASVLNLFAVRQATVPADREHRFGHGKAEPLAALAQSAFISGGALLLLAEAVRRLIWPIAVQNPPAGMAAIAISLALQVGLVLYQRRVVRRTGSLAIGADELHYRGDILLSGSVLLALALDSIVDMPLIDPLFGAGIGAWIIYSAARVAGLSLRQLMDRELPDDERAKIRRIVEEHPEVAAVHDLRTRAAGPSAFIQLHLEMDGSMSLAHAHQVSDAVEARVRAAYPNAEVIIHQDPAGIVEPRQVFPAAERA
ncbi:MAG: cation diffusion facilitator family transporter [Alphaproteobacteria bacterium]|nr:cation diffusion facilitator family transporter [Alphaproteobacteria bacterium]